MKDVVNLVNQRLKEKVNITNFDISCIRSVCGIDESKSNFFYKSKFATPQYSESFINWIVEQYVANESFFSDARMTYRTNQLTGAGEVGLTRNRISTPKSTLTI